MVGLYIEMKYVYGTKLCHTNLLYYTEANCDQLDGSNSMKLLFIFSGITLDKL